jgi:hypothetical protein
MTVSGGSTRYGTGTLAKYCQLNGLPSDITTTYCGHEFFEYPVLYYFGIGEQGSALLVMLLEGL